MRILLASLLVAAACGGPQQKHDNDIVEGAAPPPANCCCKTIPESAEKEIVPNYAFTGRMECSSNHGNCVDDVQCNGSAPPPTSTPTATPDQPTSTDTGVPPPPNLPAGN